MDLLRPLGIVAAAAAVVCAAQCVTIAGPLGPLPPTPSPVSIEVSRQHPASLRDIVSAAAIANGVPPSVPLAQIDVGENAKWNPRATHHNSDGSIDLGLMQINSRYWDEFAAAAGVVDGDPFDPVDNAEAGVSRLAALHASLGDWFDVLMAYKHGERGAMMKLRDSDYNYARRIIAQIQKEAQ